MKCMAYLSILSLPDNDPVVWASWDKMTLWSCEKISHTIWLWILLHTFGLGLFHSVTVKVPIISEARYIFRQECASIHGAAAQGSIYVLWEEWLFRLDVQELETPA